MFGETIREAARRFGDRTALSDDQGRALSYSELDRRSDAAVAHLLNAGVGIGSVVALTLPSGIDYLIAYGAVAKVGAVAAGINPSLTAVERTALLDHLGADLVVASPLPELESTSPVAELDPDPERIAAIVFTSGTTGLPKGAVFRNRQLEAICEFDLGPNWRTTWDGGGHMLASTQFAHVGFMTKVPWYLRLGVTMHVLTKWRAESVIRLIDQHRISTLGVVAPQLALMLRHPLLDELDVSCVNAIIAGGAASPPALVREAMDRFGAAYSIRYSSTESGGVGLATAFDAPLDEVLGTVGRPRPGIDVRVVDEHSVPVADGGCGELCLRTPTAFDGYWRNPEATAATLVDGWIHTGDLATIDESGLVRLSGRAKEMYIRGGYNVAPAEVEAVLCDHPLVADLAIAPRPDPVMGEIGVAVVRCTDPGVRPTLADLRAFGGEQLAAWKLPEDITFVGELPLTSMQKLDRSALAALVADTSTASTE